MIRKAIIQGDLHVSRRDSRALLDQHTAETDALFVEGRSDTIQLETHAMGYLLFLIGFLIIQSLYRMSDVIYESIPGGGEWTIEDDARDEYGLEVYDEIDAELNELWGWVGKGEQVVLYILTTIFGVFVIRYSVIGGLFHGPVTIFIVVTFPLIFSALVILRPKRNERREKTMVDSIIDASESEDYEEVLILCGDIHVSSISEKLREEGWEVEN